MKYAAGISMFLNRIEIDPAAKAREIVEMDYRTADVFRRYGINYCCGVQWPLQQVCEIQEIKMKDLVTDLQTACHTVNIPSGTQFEKWSVDFLIDYIINIHHRYLERSLPELEGGLVHFLEEHGKRFPHFTVIYEEFRNLVAMFMPHLKQEEESIFPYLRQVAHAYDDKIDPFATLLVKTLRKPLNSFADQEHTMIGEKIRRFRELTNDYIAPSKACSSHRVILGKLKELDQDLLQHLYLENDILIPKVIRMEQELLQRIY
ncbi:MAG: DUF542 domain-containing protein [Sphingobacteriales bacterium]|nr:DUF542 domain-containing protein [Sphingobacteriales bacterium]